MTHATPQDDPGAAMALPVGWPAIGLDEAQAILTAPGMPCETVETLVDGRPMPVWKNAPASLREVLETSRHYGDRIAFVHEGERVDYEAHWRAARGFAKTLTAAGIGQGDRVAIVMRNLPEWSAAFYGAAAVGAIVTPLNAWWTGAELLYALDDCGARAAIVDAERLSRQGADILTARTLSHLWVARWPDDRPLPGDARIHRLEDAIGAPGDWPGLVDGPLPDVALAPDDDAALFYTSGTTGRPKGVRLTHRAINCNIFTGLYASQRAALRRGEPLAPTGPQAPQYSGLISVPFFHVTGCVAILNLSLYGGCKLAMMRKWDPVRAFALIETEKLQSAGGVPTIVWQILEHPERGNYDLSSLDSLAWGGAPSAPELVRRIRELFPRAAPGQGWGMTETGGTFASHAGEDFVARPGSCGPASAVGRFRVLDPTDGRTEMPVGQVGELWAFGPMNARGYWNRPEETAATFVDGWVRTGDLARLDEEGFCTIVDRAKDMLIRGGENIYAIEVEAALYDHPDVMDAAVVGIPHPVLGEEPAAAVTLVAGATADPAALIAHAAGRLAAFKVPVRVLLRDEPLPRNANGKILKAEVRSWF